MPVWDLSAATSSTSYSSDTQDTGPEDVAFSADGTTMFVLGASNHVIYQYTLSTPWDVSTASYASKSFDTGTQDISPTGIAFKPDGTIMYVCAGAHRTVYQYSLSTAWDVSTASYASKSLAVVGVANSPTAITLSTDGAHLYVVGTPSSSNNYVYQYDLATPWDLSTASYASKSYHVVEDTSPGGVRFKPDGTVMFVLGQTNDTVYQYTLSTAWDVSTVSYTSISATLPPVTTLSHGLAFRTDTGESFYIAAGPGRIYEYTLGVAAVFFGWSVGSIPIGHP
jgi:sugar lactone lactonase YvrE